MKLEVEDLIYLELCSVCIGTSMRSKGCPSATSTCVFSIGRNGVCHLMIWAGTLLNVVEIQCA